MNTPEQTIIRRQDAEIRQLKEENKILISKLREVRIATAKFVRSEAESRYMTDSDKAEILKLAEEIEGEISK